MSTTPKWKYKEEIKFTKPKRIVHTVFLHCSASDVVAHDDVSVMRDWHVNDKGWSDVGYHFFVNKSGNIQEGRPLEKTPSAQYPHNTGTIAICCHGLKKSNFTSEQMTSVKSLCQAIVNEYTAKIRIRGHREVSNKDCPVYDYKKEIGIDEQGFLIPDPNLCGPLPSSFKFPPPIIKNNGRPKVLRHKNVKLLDSGTLVIALQKLLSSFGVPCTADGSFGQNTKKAVKTLQTKIGVTADGIFGRGTLNKLFSSSDLILKLNDRSKDVRVLQMLLAMHGQTIIHDGIFGSGTKRAVQTLQKRYSVKADGVFGPNTRKSLL